MDFNGFMEREGENCHRLLMGVLFPTVEFLRLEDICTHSPGPKEKAVFIAHITRRCV